MRIHLITIGTRMPAWVQEGYEEYAKRLPHECRLTLVEIPAGHRSKLGDSARAVAEEGARMLAAIPKSARVIAVDVAGKQWSTEELSRDLKTWLQDGNDVALLVGGPDGLAVEAKASASESWSLGRLTLPHPLVRVLLAEQLYRAWSLLKGHPYHRG